MLSELVTRQALESLFPINYNVGFCPFPKYDERQAWDNFSDDVKKHFNETAQKLKDQQYITLPASLYMDFKRTGDRAKYEGLTFSRRGDLLNLTIAECIEAQGEYLDSIINLVWMICEETSWVIPAHNHKGEVPDIEYMTNIDLFSAETGALISWVYYFLGDTIAKVAPTVKRRMEIEVKKHILDPFLQYNHYWWLGFGDRSVNNWNPWINSNILPAFLIFEKDRDRLLTAIEKTAKSVDIFIQSYHEDGACDEGPGYFNAAGAVMFDYLEILYKISDGKIDIYDNELIKNIARYIYRVHINGRYFVNFADSSPTTGVSARHMARVGVAIKDDDLIGFTQKFTEKGNRDISGHMRYRALRNMFDTDLIDSKPYTPPAEHWFDGNEILVMRDLDNGNTESGVFIAIKGGHNAESHNHNDVGNFVLYVNGQPVIVDAGVETYTRFTFSSERYTIWTMQSCHHNLPTINGYDQLPGKNRCSSDVKYEPSDNITSLSMDLKKAYPEEAKIDSYVRKYTFERGKSFKIRDEYKLGEAINPVTNNILCAVKPEIIDAAIKLNDNVEIVYDSNLLTAVCDEIELTDRRLRGSWDLEYLYRIRLIEKEAKTEGVINIEFKLN